MKSYEPGELEKKWQEVWEKTDAFRAEDFSDKPKYYCMFEFNYPSGDGLHVGHVRAFTSVDIIARYRRMLGYNVLFPIGWDSFGLPTENYAIKNKIHPRVATDKNIANFRKQNRALGYSVDWSREIDTTDPNYYKWTQWIFLKLYEAGLAYRSEIPINWCPFEKVGLANEEVVDGKHERCGNEVTKKVVKQWVLKITAYADRLIDDLELVDYPERVKAQQINWIGRSVGAEVDFTLESGDKITVFTTRPDTLFGATYMVLAPEHVQVEKITKDTEKEKVDEYIAATKNKSDLERQENKEKTGVFTGAYAVNPVNGEKVPVWIADYVLPDYGTGAIMAVPAHDERDYEFAKAFDLPIVEVVEKEKEELPYAGEGKLINSEQFDGMNSSEAREKIIAWLIEKNLGREKVNYKLRDWIFSRQHYWGEPIPIIHCDEDGEVPVPEDQLPIVLPDVEAYEPTETGESPLAKITDWVNTKCPKCGKDAKRETDTMPNWAGSSWYYFRYIDPKNDKVFADRKKLDYWMPVDLYEGGMEHTTLHLLYSRFWHKVLFDGGYVRDPEPYKKRRSHGIVLAADGRKMSKSFGNVVNPDDVIKDYGADTLRTYEMFMGPFEQEIAWNPSSIAGVYRFLVRVHKLVSNVADLGLDTGGEVKIPETDKVLLETELLRKMHLAIKKVTLDIEELHFNTAVAALMETSNKFGEIRAQLPISSSPEVYQTAARIMVKLLFPFAPHLCSELWAGLGETEDIQTSAWPKFDENYLTEDLAEIAVQVNGKLRATVTVTRDSTQEQVEDIALQNEKVAAYANRTTIKKVIFVSNKLINFVIPV